MEILPILQGLSTPMLLAVGAIMWQGNNRLHTLDKRLAIVEHELKEHRRTEEPQ